MSAAQISPAISVAIVLGDQPSWFSQRSCGESGAVGEDVVGRGAHVLPVRGARAAEPPGEHDRERDLVHLGAGPVLLTRHLGVLPPRAVRLLDAPQVLEQADGGGLVAERLLCRSDVVEVARPDQVVGARVLGAGQRERAPHPRHGRGGDRRAAVCLVLGGLEDHHGLVVDAAEEGTAGDAARWLLDGAQVGGPAGGVGARRACESFLQRPARRAGGGRGLGPEADGERHAIAVPLPG
jgi:hypothetical protein